MGLIEFILIILIGILFVDRFFFNKDEDKLNRKAIKALGREMNREVSFYDSLQNISIFPIDLKVEMEERFVKCAKLDEAIEMMKRGDKSLEEGIDALAKHFKVKLVRENRPATSQVVVEKAKK